MENKLIALLNDAFGVHLETLDDNAKLMELDEWDSLRHMEFILTLEGDFNMQLTGDEIAAMETIGDVREIIQSKTSSA